MKNQLMSLFQFYLYVVKSLHVSGPLAHPQEISHSRSHNHYSVVPQPTALPRAPHWWEYNTKMEYKE
jgi:hypothetical protein